MENRTKQIIFASKIAIIGNLILSILKLVVGLHSNSYAVIGDAIDSFSDVVISFVTLFTASVISKPPNPQYPFGYSKAEAVATKVLSFFIFFAGLQLLFSMTGQLFSDIPREKPHLLAFFVTAFSVIGKGALAYILYKMGEKSQSKMVRANAINMRNDIVLSFGVMIGLFFTIQYNLPIIDTYFALVIAIWILYSGYKIFLDTNEELMDGNNNIEIYNQIFKSVDSIEGASNPHRTRIRKMAHMYLIDLDIEVEPNLTVYEAHNIAVAVENKIKEDIDNVYDIMLHIEPHGNIEDEKYGLSPSDTS